jgi:hypothetical protein
MWHKLDVARNRRSGITSGVVELGDGRRSPTGSGSESRACGSGWDVDVSVRVELMGNERFEKGWGWL